MNHSVLAPSLSGPGSHQAVLIVYHTAPSALGPAITVDGHRVSRIFRPVLLLLQWSLWIIYLSGACLVSTGIYSSIPQMSTICSRFTKYRTLDGARAHDMIAMHVWRLQVQSSCNRGDPGPEPFGPTSAFQLGEGLGGIGACTQYFGQLWWEG